MAQHTINNRPAVDRAGAAEVAGIAVSNVDLLYRNRATTGFPERIEGTKLWYEDDIRAFKAKREQTKKGALTPVDRSGDPDEMIGPPEIARVVGYTSIASLSNSPIWWKLLDVEHEAKPLRGGGVRRKWPRRVVWDIAERRVGKGAPGTGRPVGTPRSGSVDRTGHPDDIVDAREAAQALGYSSPDVLPAELSERAEPRTGKAPRRWRRRTLWDFADEFRLGTPRE